MTWQLKKKLSHRHYIGAITYHRHRLFLSAFYVSLSNLLPCDTFYICVQGARKKMSRSKKKAFYCSIMSPGILNCVALDRLEEEEENCDFRVSQNFAMKSYI